MKFTCSTVINLPLQKTFQLFDNVDNLPKWQQGFESYTHLSGDKGKPGAKAKIIMQSGKHIIELIETIQVYNPPHEMTALYEHKYMINTMSNKFYKINDHSTRYEAEIHYTQFIGFLPKMMALLMPGLFKKQVQIMIDNFKKFAENETLHID